MLKVGDIIWLESGTVDIYFNKIGRNYIKILEIGKKDGSMNKCKVKILASDKKIKLFLKIN
jgi:hypothetical protein